eukprot:COSAG01_NODE_4736_length_4783_cov_24.168019_5_plen_81_part_00
MATTTKPAVAARDFRCAHCHCLPEGILARITTRIACSSDDDDDDDDDDDGASPAADKPMLIPPAPVITSPHTPVLENTGL